MILGYRDLGVYKKSYALAIRMYREVKELPEDERFGLTSQIKRASTSIPLNIAEGYGKKQSAAKFKRYLLMALGSCNEMRVLIDMCADLHYINEEDRSALREAYEEVARMLSGMIAKWK